MIQTLLVLNLRASKVKRVTATLVSSLLLLKETILPTLPKLMAPRITMLEMELLQVELVALLNMSTRNMKVLVLPILDQLVVMRHLVV